MARTRSGYREIKVEDTPKAKPANEAAGGGMDMGGLMKLLGSFGGGGGEGAATAKEPEGEDTDKQVKLALDQERDKQDKEDNDRALMESNRRRNTYGGESVNRDEFTGEVEGVREDGFKPNSLDKKGGVTSSSPGAAGATQFDLSGYSRGAGTGDRSLKELTPEQDSEPKSSGYPGPTRNGMSLSGTGDPDLKSTDAYDRDKEKVEEVSRMSYQYGDDKASVVPERGLSQEEKVAQAEIAIKKKKAELGLKGGKGDVSDIMLALIGLGSAIGGGVLSKAAGGKFDEGFLGGGAGGFGAVSDFSQKQRANKAAREKAEQAHAFDKELYDIRYPKDAKGKRTGRGLAKSPYKYYDNSTNQLKSGYYNQEDGQYYDGTHMPLSPGSHRPAMGGQGKFVDESGRVWMTDPTTGEIYEASQRLGPQNVVRPAAPKAQKGSDQDGYRYHGGSKPAPKGVATRLPSAVGPPAPVESQPVQEQQEQQDATRVNPAAMGIRGASPEAYASVGLTPEVLDTISENLRGSPQQAAAAKSLIKEYNESIQKIGERGNKNIDEINKEKRERESKAQDIAMRLKASKDLEAFKKGLVKKEDGGLSREQKQVKTSMEIDQSKKISTVSQSIQDITLNLESIKLSLDRGDTVGANGKAGLMIKALNSIKGSDAVSQEEVSRLGGQLNTFFKMIDGKPVWQNGDINAFYKQSAESTSDFMIGLEKYKADFERSAGIKHISSPVMVTDQNTAKYFRPGTVFQYKGATYIREEKTAKRIK